MPINAEELIRIHEERIINAIGIFFRSNSNEAIITMYSGNTLLLTSGSVPNISASLLKGMIRLWNSNNSGSSGLK